jgi:hypothetical protein
MAADQMRRTGTNACILNRMSCSFSKARVSSQPQIIIRAKGEHLLAINHQLDRLLAIDNTTLPIQALITTALQLRR